MINNNQITEFLTTKKQLESEMRAEEIRIIAQVEISAIFRSET